MSVINYYSIGGEIIGEEVGGSRRDYLTDALGSVTATVTGSGVVENTYRYKPYGEQLAKTGTGSDPKFLWNGKWGYLFKGKITYVRSRHYMFGWWISSDTYRKFPWRWRYNYCNGNPINRYDYFGLFCSPDCCGKISFSKCPSGAQIWNEDEHNIDRENCNKDNSRAIRTELINSIASLARSCKPLCLGKKTALNYPWSAAFFCCYDQNGKCRSQGIWKCVDRISSASSCAKVCLFEHEKTHKWQCEKGIINNSSATHLECQSFAVQIMCLMKKLYGIDPNFKFYDETQKNIQNCIGYGYGFYSFTGYRGISK
jgi:hypothetical protein